MLFKRKRNDDEKISLANYTITSILGADAVIEGTIITKSSVRIDGTLIGGVIADGVVILSKGGKIKGNVMAESIIVAGTVEGNMKIREKVNVEPTGVIYGDITTKKLLIDEESVFQGQCFMNREKTFESAEEQINRVKEEDISFGAANSKNHENNGKTGYRASAQKTQDQKASEKKTIEGKAIDDKDVEKKTPVKENTTGQKINEQKKADNSNNKSEGDNLSAPKEKSENNEKPESIQKIKNKEKISQNGNLKGNIPNLIGESEREVNLEKLNEAEQAVREMNKKALKALLDSGDSDIDYFEVSSNKKEADKNKH